MDKNPPTNAGDTGLIPGLGRFHIPKEKEKVVSDSCDLWTVARQPPLSMGFSKQEYWSGLPFPSPEDLPDAGTEPRSPALQADSLPTELRGKPHMQRSN